MRRHDCNVHCSDSIDLNGEEPDSYSIGTEGESQMCHGKMRGEEI